MKEERIVVTISEEGDVSIDVQGVKGKKCLELTKGLEEALGVVKERKEKPAMRERPARVTSKNVQRVHR